MIAFAFVCDATIDECECISWVKPDNLTVVGNGSFVLTLTIVGDAAVIIGQVKFRVELYRLIVISNGLLVFTLTSVCVAPIEKREGISWNKPDNLTVVRDG